MHTTKENDMDETMRAYHQRNLEGHKRALARAEGKRDRKQIAEQSRLIAEITAILSPSGLPESLIGRMTAAKVAAAEPCSVCGVGRGRWCAHRDA